MLNFLKENWVPILTLIIALSGGIPGIFIIVGYFYNRPIFGFTTEGIMRGTIEKNKNASIVLFGVVTNKGKKPLHPRVFGLEVEFKNKWISFQGKTISENCKFTSEEQHLELKDLVKNDLQRWNQPITIENPASGNLWFTSDKVDSESFKHSDSIKFRLICLDIFGKKYTVTIEKSIPDDSGIRQALPKHGVIFGPAEE